MGFYMGRVVDTSGAVGDLSLRLADEFAAFGPAYLKWVRSRMARSGLSYARMRLLEALRCGGPKIMSSISDELGVTRRNVTALVDGLEEEGLVRRRPHPTDRRATVIELTGKGREKVDGMYDEHRAAVAEVFEGLSDDERRELIRLLSTVRAALREREHCCQQPR
jgi:DNA-binding MarR family transcriptional regulator